MITPKRVLLLVLGFLLFFTAYQVYLYFFGGYDGLSPLPSEYQRADRDAPVRVAAELNISPVVRRLQQAFGVNSEECKRPIKLEWGTQGVVVAAEKCYLPGNGKLALEKVSVAIFGKQKPEEKDIEINTLQGDRAEIEFDKPITGLRDANNRKPIGGRIEAIRDALSPRSQVRLRNNRRTTNPDDDLHLYAEWLEYRDDQHRIWTNGPVEIIDSDPDNARMQATGMEVRLLTEPAKPAAHANPKKSRPAITGVRTVRLDKDVQMVFSVDAKDALISSGQKSTPTAVGPPARTQKTPVKVFAEGPFTYDNTQDLAEFVKNVVVVRSLPPLPAPPDAIQAVRLDEMKCDHLTLVFSRKGNVDRRKLSTERGAPLELQAVRAAGKPVEILSDAEHLHATGEELIYEKEANRTTLRGPLVTALHHGHEMHIRGELLLRGGGQDGKELEEAQAVGPGAIRLKGRMDDQPVLIARWRDSLKSAKDGSQDRLVLSGEAVFEDPARGWLRADQLIVWLESAQAGASLRLPAEQDRNRGVGPNADLNTVPRTADRDRPPKSAGEVRRVPRRLEAVGKVSLRSADLVIPLAEHLVVVLEDAKELEAPPPVAAPRTGGSWFHIPAMHSEDQRPGPPAPAVPPPPPSIIASALPPEPPYPVSPPPISPHIVPPPRNDKTAKPRTTSDTPQFLPAADMASKSPIILHARTVEATLLRGRSRADLQKLFAEGNVHVEQRAATAKDKSSDIRCNQLALTHTDDGNVLRIVGLPGEPARLQLDRLSILGPVIKIDQVQNHLEVKGLGAMRMPSKTDFQGNALQEAADVVIDWNEQMFFDGRLAEFDGGVQAVQAGSRLACRKLGVILEERVSFKEKQAGRDEQPAALYRLFCDQDVRLERGVNEPGKPREFYRIEGRELAFEKAEALLSVHGPGTSTMLQAGGRQLTPPPSVPQPAVPSKPTAELKLTRITYEGHMQARKAEDRLTDIVVFNGGVNLVHLPAEDPDAAIDLDNLPPEALTLSCGELRMLSRKDGPAAAHEMTARGQVRVKARGFHALADRVTFDENKDLLILEGQGDVPATLWRQKAPGAPFEPVKAKKIWYWRKDNRVRFDQTEIISGTP